MQAPRLGATPLARGQQLRPVRPFLGGVSLAKQQRGVPAGGLGRSRAPGLSHLPLHVATLPHAAQAATQQQQQQQRRRRHDRGPALPQQQQRPRGSVAARAKKDDDEEEEELKKDWKFGRNEGPMNWQWKLCCAVLYMLPWVDVTEKTVYFIERFPAFHWTEYFTEPFEHWFYIHEWAPLIIFFGTYLGIVRNKKIPHVARYHIMMGIMLDIVAMILIVVEENLPFGILWSPWSDLMYALMFWFVFLLVVYCLFFCFMGWYCEIPLISEGVYIQIEQAESMGA